VLVEMMPYVYHTAPVNAARTFHVDGAAAEVESSSRDRGGIGDMLNGALGAAGMRVWMGRGTSDLEVDLRDSSDRHLI